MKIKLLIGLTCLLLFSLSVPVIACECDPSCEGCQSCEAGVCVDDPSLCIPCQNCEGGECVDDDDLCFGCERCSFSYCIDDNTKCNSCQNCSGGDCILKPTSECDEDSDCGLPGCWNCVNCKCEYICNFLENCEVCIGGECIVCGVINETHCCVGDGECVEKCDQYGGNVCTWTNPPVQDPLCNWMWDTNPNCLNPGAICSWTVVGGPIWNDVCAPCDPGCSLGTTHCVKLQPKKCKEIFIPFMGMVCYCREATGSELAGTRYTCP